MMATLSERYEAHAGWCDSQVPQYISLAQEAMKQETKDRYIAMASRYKEASIWWRQHAKEME